MSNFLERTIERAKADRKRIVLAEGEDIRSIKAASIIVEKDICDVVLLGNAEKIAETAGDISLEGVEIIDPAKSDKLEEFANAFYEMRKAKGMTEEKAHETMLNSLYFFNAFLFLKGFLLFVFTKSPVSTVACGI